MFSFFGFRGCDKEALNYANQTPYQVAVIAGNLELADVIKNHRPEEVGKSLLVNERRVHNCFGHETLTLNGKAALKNNSICVNA